MVESEITPEYPAMPDLLGMDIDRAKRLLELAGVRRPLIRRVPERGQRGIIQEQTPAPGDALTPDVRVRLQIEDDNPIRHLPEVFRDEDRKPIDSFGQERPVHMLRSFLFIIQALMGQMEQEVMHMDRQLSPEGASESFLPWLQGLLPMEWDASWSSDYVRAVMRDAPRLLLKRGSAEGLEEMIALQSGITVKVHENGWPQRGAVIGSARIAESAIVSTVPGDGDAFYIEISPGQDVSRAQLERILRIVDQEKPVHLRSMVTQAAAPQPQTSSASAIGHDFIIGVTPVSGLVVTPPARIGVPNFVAGPSGDGGFDPAVWATEGLSAE